MLQFGQPRPDLTYRVRPTAFGLVLRDGLLACVRVERETGPYFDLPGGAVDGQETEPQALAREFLEEAGLEVAPGERLCEAGQYFRRTDGEALNNTGGYWTAVVTAERPEAQCEADHTLVWLEPSVAIAQLRHDAHAWAVAVWMRHTN